MNALPCGCLPDPKRALYCPVARDMIYRNAALLIAACEAMENGDEPERMEALATYSAGFAEFLQHVRGVKA